jgi:hypothetical protein
MTHTNLLNCENLVSQAFGVHINQASIYDFVAPNITETILNSENYHQYLT